MCIVYFFIDVSCTSILLKFHSCAIFCCAKIAFVLCAHNSDCGDKRKFLVEEMQRKDLKSFLKCLFLWNISFIMFKLMLLSY